MLFRILRESKRDAWLIHNTQPGVIPTTLKLFPHKMWPGMAEFEQLADGLDQNKVSRIAESTMIAPEIPDKQLTPKQLGELQKKTRFVSDKTLEEYRSSMVKNPDFGRAPA